MNFLDEASRELYTYEVADSHGDAMVAALDLTTKEWRPASSDYLCQQLHHHCGFFHPGERKFSCLAVTEAVDTAIRSWRTI